jgi:hypothetical protein
MICLETPEGGEKKNNYRGNGEDKKCISVAGIIKINVRQPGYTMYKTPEYLLPLKEHPYRNQQKSENEKPRENYINEKPQVGAPFIKNCRYNKEK